VASGLSGGLIEATFDGQYFAVRSNTAISMSSIGVSLLQVARGPTGSILSVFYSGVSPNVLAPSNVAATVTAFGSNVTLQVPGLYSPLTTFDNTMPTAYCVNNYSPSFPSPSTTVVLQNNASVGALVFRTAATDRDLGANADITYSLSVSQGVPGYFALQSGGVIVVAQSLVLLQETTFVLTLTASDGGIPPRSSSMTVIISL